MRVRFALWWTVRKLTADRMCWSPSGDTLFASTEFSTFAYPVYVHRPRCETQC
jgi:hypothetical protein